MQTPMMLVNKLPVPTTMAATWQLDPLEAMQAEERYSAPAIPVSLAGPAAGAGAGYMQSATQMQQLYMASQGMPAAQPSMMLKPDFGQLYQDAGYLGQDLAAASLGMADQLQGMSQQQFAAATAGMSGVRGEQYLNQTTSNEVCMFFMRTGTCAFGSRCRFKHPMNRPQVQLNSGGYPIRPAVPNCAHYVSKGWCAFGTTCKFNHPEPTSFLQPPQQMGMPDQMVAATTAAGANPNFFPYGMQ